MTGLIFTKRLFKRIKYLPLFIHEAAIWQYETCQKCGNAFRIRWHVNDEIWQKVMNVKDDSGGSMCLDCFVKKAEKISIILKDTDIRMELFYGD